MYDQFDDKNKKQLYRFSKVIEFPEFVKTASASEGDDRDNIPSNCFADPSNRKFPVHTKNDTYLSRLYFTKNQDMYKSAELRDSVSENIDKAVKFWGIEDSYSVYEEQEKMAYRLPIVDYQGNEIDQWVLQTPRDFEKAAIQIFENKSKFTYPQRRTLAKKMLNIPFKKEANLNEDVWEYMEKAAGYGMCTKEQVMSAIEDRASLYHRISPEFSERLVKVAEEAANTDINPTFLDKVATIFDVCDKELNCARFYRPEFETPEETLFRFTEKRASEIKEAYVTLINGQNLELDKIAEDKLDRFFEDYLGEVPDGDMQEKIAVVKTLPAPDAEALVKFLEN